MSARSLSLIGSGALAVLMGLGVQALSPAHAANGYLAIKKNAATCIDQSLPAATRIASCTQIIDFATQKGSGPSSAMTRVAAISLVARATAFAQQGDDRAALEDFTSAAKNDPQSELPWLGLGNFYMAKANFARALQSYDEVLKLAPKDPVGYDDHGAALVALNRNEEAVADFTRALGLDQKDTTALSNRATLYLRSDRAALAIADLTGVIRAQPGNAVAFYNRGTAYEQSDELDKAVADYRTAAHLQPSYAPAYDGLGRVLARKDPQAALSELSDAIGRNAHSPALRGRAILYLSLGRFEPALEDFNQAIALDGGDNIAYLDRGVAEQELGDLQGALKDYSRSIELDNTAAAHIDRGSVYQGLGEHDKALIDFEAALAIEPKNVTALIGQADANYAVSGEDPEQLAANLKDYSAVIEAAPNNAAAYFVRGNIYFDLKNYSAAYHDYTAGLALNPNQPAALFNRALTEAHLGRSADAVKDQRAARELDATIGRETQRPATVTEYAQAHTSRDGPRIAFAQPRAAPAEAPLPSEEAPKGTQQVTIRGYRLVMMAGKERYCRTEVNTGSRANRQTICLTKQQLDAEEENKRTLIETVQKWSGIGVLPAMCGGAMAGAGGSACFGAGSTMFSNGGAQGGRP